MSAPIAITSAEVPVNPLPLPAVVPVEMVGTAVVVVGTATVGCGNPGDRGLLVLGGMSAGLLEP
jgi:hypothetical protein